MATRELNPLLEAGGRNIGAWLLLALVCLQSVPLAAIGSIELGVRWGEAPDRDCITANR